MTGAAVWFIGGFIMGALFGAWLILYSLICMQDNLTQMFHQTPKDES